ncbi:hypothetical protein ACWEQL_16150 [Kitasatospora sp. NPDC004240]
MSAEGGGAGQRRRYGLLVVAFHIVAMGLWVLVQFGSEVLAGAGWAGERGTMAVSRCVDSYVSNADRGGGGTVHHCFGTFRPDGGGPEVTGVELKGGRGDEYAPPRPGSSCARPADVRPGWCGPDRSNEVPARYLHDKVWIFGSGLILPGGAALLGLAVVGGGLLVAAHGWWPAEGLRPRPVRSAPKALVGLTVVGTLTLFLGMLPSLDV